MPEPKPSFPASGGRLQAASTASLIFLFILPCWGDLSIAHHLGAQSVFLVPLLQPLCDAGAPGGEVALPDLTLAISQ